MLKLNEHRKIMLLILKDIYKNSKLGSYLGFKGGTALYLLFGLPRFSVDLDFDLIDFSKKEFVFTEISKILGEYGKLEQFEDKNYTLFYILNYQKGLQNLKIEISKRPGKAKYELASHLGVPFLVMVRPDMFANKLCALLGRKQIANRDLFDLHFYLEENWPINFELVEEKTGMKYRDYVSKCLSVIGGISSETLLANMGELVDNKTKFWIKTKLKDELLTLLRIHLDSLQG